MAQGSRHRKSDALTNTGIDYLVLGGKIDKVINMMKSHPNYVKPIPQDNETKTQFILRSIAHLISPPQDEGETYEIECIDIKNAVLGMEKELELIWEQHKK